MIDNHTWALVLAAGDGNRLKSLTTCGDGLAVPKQFCSLLGGPSLLEDTLARARALVPGERIFTIVAAKHRRWWNSPQCLAACANFIVQPQNRGTGIGMLLALLHILERDPLARIVFLPSDHYVQDETILRDALHEASEQLAAEQDKLLILGLEPAKIDSDLGYILPGTERGAGKFDVALFVEKPSAPIAKELISRGALWNTFIIAAGGFKLLRMLEQRCGTIVSQLRSAVQKSMHLSLGDCAVEEVYRRLPTVDFSRDVLEGQEGCLRVLRVPQCGWSDLGTPDRVAEVLYRSAYSASSATSPADVGDSGTYVSLAFQHRLAAAQHSAAPSRR
jgi:mannose-1-phosphate guanylyltransferase